jgi:hypothetical protein
MIPCVLSLALSYHHFINENPFYIANKPTLTPWGLGKATTTTVNMKREIEWR